MADHLAIYLNDHLMGATAGLELFGRAARNVPAVAPPVPEIEADRQALIDIIERVGARPDRIKIAAGWTGEKLGRLKLNGELLTRSPLSTLIELEGLTRGCRASWPAGGCSGPSRTRASTLASLIDRAARQAEQLEELRPQAAQAVLARLDLASVCPPADPQRDDDPEHGETEADDRGEGE